MQPTPFRLSQAIWTAFRTAKPSHRQSPFQYAQIASKHSPPQPLARHIPQSPFRGCVRGYADEAKTSEIEKQAAHAKQKIEQSLDSRADVAQDARPPLKQPKDETIVHTVPEASSIVFTKDAPSDNPENPILSKKDADESSSQDSYNNNTYAAWASSQWQNSPLPSQIASLRSRATKRFTSFMDNFQSQIVVAAHHINDLTGYTGIERLKKEIEAQENSVQNARQHVKDSREKYSEAISMRSTTQREVNDLLHRKHAWTPPDLERFTELYRSDHDNEKAEQRSHQQLSEAEAQYEEASTRLAKSILARYHEEQIWSDKIRQMSTWGTWGLMGLNVLLFIVFQIAIEPWRRRRLVRGFEEKVQAALDEKEKATNEQIALIQANRSGDQIVQEAVQKQPEGVVATAAEVVAETIADAVAGVTKPSEELGESPKLEDIENAAGRVTQKELDDEAGLEDQAQVSAAAVYDPASTDSGASSSDSTSQPANSETRLLEVPVLEPEVPRPWQDQVKGAFRQAIDTTEETYAYYNSELVRQFNEKEHVVLSRRELTTRVLEGVAAGVALTCGIAFVVIRGR